MANNRILLFYNQRIEKYYNAVQKKIIEDFRKNISDITIDIYKNLKLISDKNNKIRIIIR